MPTLIPQPQDRRTRVAIQASYLRTALLAVRSAVALEPADGDDRAELQATAAAIGVAYNTRAHEYLILSATTPTPVG